METALKPPTSTPPPRPSSSARIVASPRFPETQVLLLPSTPPAKLTRSVPDLPSRPTRFPYDSPFRSLGSKREGTPVADADADAVAGWKVETLCFQAAKPRRCPCSVKLRDGPSFDPNEDLREGTSRLDYETAEKRCMELLEEVEEAEISCERERREGLGEDGEELRRRAEREEDLLVAANRYYRSGVVGAGAGGGDGVTMIFFHGNGFGKEMWEPTMGAVIQDLARSGGGHEVEEIWALDATAQGDSAILNDGFLGPLAGDWQDQARDYLHFLIHFMPANIRSRSPDSPGKETTSTTPSSTVFSETTFKPPILDARKPDTPRSRSRSRSRRRKLLLCGHSMGGANLISTVSNLHNLPTSQTSEFFDRFDIVGMTVVDPVLRDPKVPVGPLGPGTLVSMVGGLKRRPRWPIEAREGSVSDLEDSIRRDLKRLLEKLDSDVAERYLSFGLWRPPPPPPPPPTGGRGRDRGIALKCLPRIEACTYDIHRTQHGFISLRHLPTSLPILFVFPDREASVIPPSGLPNFRDNLPRGAELRWFDGYSHVIPFQNPDLIGREVARLIRGSREREAVRKAKL